ncbi:MAG: hypothetical protein WCD76_15830 [Pyrinomonadaceae bacterium]
MKETTDKRENRLGVIKSLTALIAVLILVQRATSNIPYLLSAKNTQNVSNLDGLRQEYTEVNNNIRHYSALRFAIFPVYFVAFGGLISVAFSLFGAQSDNSEFLKLGAKISGVLITVLFFHYEYLIEEVLNKNRKRGEELEKKLNYQQIRSRSQNAIYTSQYMARGFYCILLLFWLVMIILSIRVFIRA